MSPDQDPLEIHDQLAASLDEYGVACAAMPPGVSPAAAAEWLLATARSVDLLASERDDLVVGAYPGSALGVGYDACPLAWCAFSTEKEIDEDAIKKALGR